MDKKFETLIGVSLPGESVVAAIIRLVERHRETMSQDNRDKWDALALAQARAWHNFWIENGWPGEKV